ncbi:MAG: hypothetical protein CVU39_15710 [Chloroflexi bacterium HGW-Chloroflexi-10]|nr:MAG: hypothetical protein CVU39_15710 [Chloroflexi bacterium HGW-Chloroflexi-10]
MFDLYIYPFGIHQGKEISQLTGYFVSNAPKKAARSRVSDILIIRFTPQVESNSSKKLFLDTLLSGSSEYYYKSSGPITTACRKTADFLNERLVNFNLNQETALTGTLQILVVHQNDIYIIQTGTSTVFLLSRTKFDQFTDKSIGTQLIGISKTVSYRYYHANISSGDRLILSAKMPSTWKARDLLDGSRTSIGHLRKDLIRQTQQDFEAVILQFRTGDGSIHQLKLDTSALAEEKRNEINELPSSAPGPSFTRPTVSTTPALETTASGQELPHAAVETPEQWPVSPEKETRQGSFEPVHSSLVSVVKAPLEAEPHAKEVISQPENKQEGIYLSGEPWKSSNPEKSVKKRSENYSRKPLIDEKRVADSIKKTRLGFIQISRGWNKVKSTISKGLLTLFQRANPDDSNQSNSISPGFMLFVAILVPVIVAAIGFTVYSQDGRVKEHEKLVIHATELVSLAEAETDVVAQLQIFQQAFQTVLDAEHFGNTDASVDLKNYVQAKLDTLQGVTRIKVVSTVPGGVVRGLKIVSMVAAPNEDIYALDAETGQVLRLVPTRPDYQVDNTFSCGPGKQGTLYVNKLVDITPINIPNKTNSTILAVDETGNLLICGPGVNPAAIQLPVPEIGWSKIKAIAFNGYNLFVLDVGENTKDLYRISSSSELAFDSSPRSLFGFEIPVNLGGMLDVAVYQDDLFVLHQSGQLMKCIIGTEFIETQCDMNSGYGIIQSGQSRETVESISGATFISLSITQPPDPSIYFLDMNGQSVYHFSLALNMQKQIHTDLSSLLFPPDQSMTAFAVSPAGFIHFAFGDQLYFGNLP